MFIYRADIFLVDNNNESSGMKHRKESYLIHFKTIFVYFILTFIFQSTNVLAETNIPMPNQLEQDYPRIYTTLKEKKALENTIRKEAWAQKVVEEIHKTVDEHVKRHVHDNEWMPSRLQMYWKTQAKNVYVNGASYSHADGKAPKPTVRFTGARSHHTSYAKPALEDILPYMDDPRGLYLPNKSKKGQPFEWAEQAKTGSIIHKINQDIVGLARNAAFLYWLENDTNFAKFAYDIFHVYMQGMFYRSEPIDLLNGHIQTLVGLTSFQVIHENTLQEIAVLYDFLNTYIKKNHPENIDMYEATIKKWINLIIKNGVPQNNWNLHQANIILKAAMVLRDDSYYADKQGREYYLNYLLNVTSARQWSLSKFLNYGYDKNNGVWAESPGYSQGVTRALTHFIKDFDNTFDHNLLPYAPVMHKAVQVLPQYLFPNGQTIAFGDSYYDVLNTQPISDMIRIAQKNKDTDMEHKYTAMYRLFSSPIQSSDKSKKTRASIDDLFASKPLVLNPNVPQAKLEDYITQTFYAPNVSWHAQRIGTGTHGMMVSLNASLGNHMHANGINMELYGKGIVQGADPGKGAGYLEPIYLEYYSQFPAHNTVMVDGTSSYTEMLSNHAFDLNNEYPKSEQKSGFYPDITYSDVYFLEPETSSDQSRLVSIVKTGETTGYYLDIFRSKKQKKGDKFHDYYYHNLGQSMQIMDPSGKPLSLSPSEDMGFAGGHLYALDYMWEKKSLRTDEDYQAEWKIDMPDGQDDVFMNLWMKGTAGREVFSIKSPPNKAFRKNHSLPYDVGTSPYLTLTARQHGEAWQHPFVSVFEPFTSAKGKSIKQIESFDDEHKNPEFIGLKVIHKSGREDLVFSTTGMATVKYKQVITDATYAVITKENNDNFTLFIGNGSQLSANGISISSVNKSKSNIVLQQKDGHFYLHNIEAVKIKFNGKTTRFAAADLRSVRL
jgi:hypothetical protein